MAAPDTVPERIGHGIELAATGQRDAARRHLSALWEQIGPFGNPVHVCALAHFLADVCDDVRDELAWDLLALGAAGAVTDEQVRAVNGGPSVRSWYPSLHLNAGDAYRRIGDLARARDHCGRGLAAAGALGDDGYGRMILSGLHRLDDRITRAVPGSEHAPVTAGHDNRAAPSPPDGTVARAP